MKFRIFSLVSLLLAGVSTASAAEFDIAGMKIGSSADQVVEQVKSFKEGIEYRFNYWQLPEGSKWIANGGTLYNDMRNPDDIESERFNFAFTGLGSGNKLFGISRELKFRPSGRPAYKAVADAAIKKFGKPSYVSESNNDIWVYWKFTSKDAPAVPLESGLSCNTGSDIPSSLDERAQTMTEFCGLYVEMYVDGEETGLAERMQMSVVNYLDAAADFKADNDHAIKLINQAKQDNSANAAPVPQL